MQERLTITAVARELGVTTRTIMRWEKAGKIKKSKRDWRGWRFYHKEDLAAIKEFLDRAYDLEEIRNGMFNGVKNTSIVILALAAFLTSILYAPVSAASSGSAQTRGIRETDKTIDIVLEDLPAINASDDSPFREPIKYTLGPDDVIEIEVVRHPEFSGTYTINSEGKIEYKYVGDIIIAGLTKKELVERLTDILSEYLISPDVDVRIKAYLSKVFYVVGEVGRPGKFYMKGNIISVREALVQAGLPLHTAAMRRARLITPDGTGRNNYVAVNVYSLLYEGNLEENLEMNPGDVLYVPATAMAKMLRVISPITGAARETVGAAATGAALGL